MIRINELINKIRKKGYENRLIKARACQDIFLSLLADSKYKNSLTIKGGVVINNISNCVRRGTPDIDVDFIHFPLTDNSIKELINDLNHNNLGIKISINKKIEDLNHEIYKGKRVYLKIDDKFKSSISCKIDIGVHKYISIKQREYCFNVDSVKDKVILYINSNEQMFTEKLKSLLMFGVRSRRLKDIYDLYYLKDFLDLDKLKLCLKTLIFSDDDLDVKSNRDIYNVLNNIFSDQVFMDKLSATERNWIEINNSIVLDSLLRFFSDLIY